MTLLWPWRAGLGPVLLVLVVVVAVGGVAVAIVGVVDVVAVGEGIVPAVRPVDVVVAGVGQVGQRVLVVVALVRGVGVAFVNIVGVAFALHAGVPATGPVVVRVRGVHLMLSRCHDSSLLCWTASATMWATCWSASEYAASRPCRSTPTRRAPRSTRRWEETSGWLIPSRSTSSCTNRGWSASSITIASRAGAARTFRSSPAASNAFVCADTDTIPHKHISIYLCKRRRGASVTAAATGSGRSGAPGIRIGSSHGCALVALRLSHRLCFIHAADNPPFPPRPAPPHGPGRGPGRPGGRAGTGGGRLQRRWWWWWHGFCQRRHSDHCGRRRKRVRQCAGPDRRPVRACVGDPGQPEHRPAHVRGQPAGGPGGQFGAADRAERG